MSIAGNLYVTDLQNVNMTGLCLQSCLFSNASFLLYKFNNSKQSYIHIWQRTLPRKVGKCALNPVPSHHRQIYFKSSSSLGFFFSKQEFQNSWHAVCQPDIAEGLCWVTPLCWLWVGSRSSRSPTIALQVPHQGIRREDSGAGYLGREILLLYFL